MVIGIVIAVVAGIAGLACYHWPAARAARTLRRLESRYFRKVYMPRHLAEEALERHVARLRHRHPGHGPAWNLAQVLSDLDRDRR